MDLVTLYMILTIADGTPRAWQTQIAAEMCEAAAEDVRRRQANSLAWCASELEKLMSWPR